MMKLIKALGWLIAGATLFRAVLGGFMGVEGAYNHAFELAGMRVSITYWFAVGMSVLSAGFVLYQFRPIIKNFFRR
jgi:hypothetical protein